MPSYTVTTSATTDEPTIWCLLGDFAHAGEHHGRPYFQKVSRAEQIESGQAFLYYWDDRDGVDFSGWYFGPALGGRLVWSRAAATTACPPKAMRLNIDPLAASESGRRDSQRETP